MRKVKFWLVVGASFLLHGMGANSSWAGGFTQPEGAAFVSTTFRTLASRTFEKWELEAYAEYGLRENITLIFKVPYQWIRDEQFNPARTNSGFFDGEVGVRWRFTQDPRWAAALQVTPIIPLGYDPNAPLPLSRGGVGLDVRVPVSRSFAVGNRFGYWTIEVAYRPYFSRRSDEFRTFAEVAIPVTDRLDVAAQIDSIIGTQDREADFTKVVGQFRIKANDFIRVVPAAYKQIDGPGYGFELGVWLTFGGAIATGK
ncbi:MAG: hypothetical protein RMI89_00940 [Gloeomargarita sp. SKYBB_i_bin120]|nr:hypothetical protein [Gloeomargarita sp. SKYG98]MCS7291527.1 hypothetical protein [Gloeomargarita sp. SKYB120]MDW8177087.1 hypothetical protein [Gloeomargarita sp. SKYBB_i_bin120]